MGRDNQPKHRQQKQLERKLAQRASHDRILIVSEGSKTEPLYFEEIRNTYRLHSANVAVQPSGWGTDPKNVVKYACHLFKNGDAQKRIRPRSFEKVFAVFDRDDHTNYFEALSIANATNNSLLNDAKQRIEFHAIASIPCFELWLLLHFEDIQHWLHRDEVFQRLKQHMASYSKGRGQCFEETRDQLEIAFERARRLSQDGSPFIDTIPYTGIHELVELLVDLND